jgi:glycosyltransferase involved in cell wall biosynthesis
VANVIQRLRPLALQREARLLAGAAGVTIVSEAWASDLDTRFNVGSKLKVVTNGYDPEEVRDVEPHDFGHFAIVYAGTFYPPERVITPVLEALKRLDNQGMSREWYFHYYGDHNQHVREDAARLGVTNRVKLHGRVPRSEALSAIRGANIAVVINSVLEETPVRIIGWVPAKMFEIIALGTPVLMIAPPGSDVETIARTWGGMTGRFSGSDISGIESFLEKLMAGCKVERGNGDPFAWKRISAMFDAHLRKQLQALKLSGNPS